MLMSVWSCCPLCGEAQSIAANESGNRVFLGHENQAINNNTYDSRDSGKTTPWKR
jgi:hypothetical protein